MKVRSHFYTPAALATLALLTVACAAGKTGGGGALHVWPAGTAVTYDLTASQTQTIEIPGGGTQGGTSTSTIVFDVASTGAREFQVSVTDASTYSDTPDPSSPDIGNLVGLKSTVTLDERGLLIEATGLTENSYVMEAGGVDDFKETLQALFLYLPEGKLGPGVEWSREYNYPAVQGGLEIQVNSVDTYKCLEETTYEGTPAFKLEVTSEVTFSGSGEQAGQMLDFALAGTGTATMHVDASTGLLLNMESTGALNGVIASSGMEFPMSMQTVSTIKIRK